MAVHALQDRRGVNLPRNFGIVFGVLAFAALAAGYSFVALFNLLVAMMSIYLWERITRPPVNNPAHFLKRFRELSPPRPVLVCLGDSLTHGRVSDDWTRKIPSKIATKMKFDRPEQRDFMDPVWVVNAGQNSITSWVILQERLQAALACYPDYILIMIGTNDVLAMNSPIVSNDKVASFDLPDPPSMAGLERNLRGIVDFISKASPKTEIGLCTLPPMGEDLTSPVNKLVKQANEIIHALSDEDGTCTTVQVGEGLQNQIIQKKNRQERATSAATSSPMMMVILMMVQAPLHFLFGVSWNVLTK